MARPLIGLTTYVQQGVFGPGELRGTMDGGESWAPLPVSPVGKA